MVTFTKIRDHQIGRMSWTRRLCIVGLAILANLVMAGCTKYNKVAESMTPPTHHTQPGQVTTKEYIVEPPDEIEITVRNAPELTSTQQVRPDGRITVGIFGEVKVAGLTPMEIGLKLEKFLSTYYRDVEVSVAVTGFNSKHFYMFGQVGGQLGGARGQTEGIQPYEGQETMLEAIGRVGGISLIANPRRIILIRPNAYKGNTPERYKVNLKHIIVDGDFATNYFIREGDIILVPPTPLGAFGIALNNLFFPFRNLFAAASATDTVIDLGAN